MNQRQRWLIRSRWVIVARARELERWLDCAAHRPGERAITLQQQVEPALLARGRGGGLAWIDCHNARTSLTAFAPAAAWFFLFLLGQTQLCHFASQSHVFACGSTVLANLLCAVFPRVARKNRTRLQRPYRFARARAKK